MSPIARFPKPTRSPRRFLRSFGSATLMRLPMDKLEFKATLSVTDAGEITGNAWPFGSADSANDIITKGAFNIAVANMPMLFGHNPDDLIGNWDEIVETSDALVAKGKLH